MWYAIECASLLLNHYRMCFHQNSEKCRCFSIYEAWKQQIASLIDEYKFNQCSTNFLSVCFVCESMKALKNLLYILRIRFRFVLSTQRALVNMTLLIKIRSRLDFF